MRVSKQDVQPRSHLLRHSGRGAEGLKQTYAAFFLGFAGRREGVGREPTFISRAAPSAVAARDIESMVMVGLASSSSEWTAIRLVPIRRAISEIDNPILHVDHMQVV
jgi:hypothetical protein